MAPWTSPPRGLSQVSLVVREAAGGAWSLAEHFPEPSLHTPRESPAARPAELCPRHTQRWPGRCPPLATPGPVHLPGGDHFYQAPTPAPSTPTASRTEKPRRSAGGVGEGGSCRRRPGSNSRGRDCSLYTFPPHSHLLASCLGGDRLETAENTHPPGSACCGRHLLVRPAAVPTPSRGSRRAGSSGNRLGRPPAAALEPSPPHSVDATCPHPHPGAQLPSHRPLPSQKRRPPLSALSPGLLHGAPNGGGRVRWASPAGRPLAGRLARAELEKAEPLEGFETAIRATLREADPPKGEKDLPGRGSKMGS